MDEPEGHSYTIHCIRDGESVTQAVVRAMSTETRTDPLELPPLYPAVDPDALDALFGAPAGSSARPSCTVVFEYDGREIRVNGTGTIQISTT